MTDRRRRRSRAPTAGRAEDTPLGYYDEREAAMERADYKEIMEFTPHNIEAEAALLGALLIDNRWVERIENKLRPTHFLEPAHGRIYERICTLVRKGKLANPITLRPYFEGEVVATVDDETGHTVEKPLVGYLAVLTGSGAALIGADQFAQQIVDLAMLREVIGVAREMGENAADTAEEVNPRRVIELAETRLLEITDQLQDRPVTGATWESAFEESIAEAETIADGGEAPGITIRGYDDWNDVVGRMQAGDYILLGGRPSMGKTAVACAVATGAALLEHGVDFLSLEMSRQAISWRMLANVIYEQGVTSGLTALREGRWTAQDRKAIAAGKALIAGKPLYIDAPDSMMVEELIPWLRLRKRIWQRRGIEQRLCVIDYLERFATRETFKSEQERVSYISRKVKDAAKECGVTILMLAQLSRGVEQREDKRPVLSDLRQSGSLEQDADTAVFVYRDQYYLERSRPAKDSGAKYDEWRDDLAASRDRVELYSGKRREGALTKRTGYFFTDEQALRSSQFYRTDLYSGGTADFGGGYGDGQYGMT